MKLNQHEYENLFDCIDTIEQDYSIHFEESEFETISNFDELIDLTLSKINLTDTSNCTKQQAFYKLRKAIADQKKLNPKDIHPKTEILDLLTSKKIRSEITLLEQKLGFSLHLLEPSDVIIGMLAISTFFSLILLFIHVEMGIILLLLSLISIKLTYLLNRKSNVKTVGELAERITNLHYLKVRKDPGTINKSELRKVFWNLFSDYIGLDQKQLQMIHFK